MTIRAVEAGERPRALNIQMLAFQVDPIVRWLWPEPDAYMRHFPALLAGFGGRAFENGTAYVTDDFSGGTLWLPPGVGADDDAMEAMARDLVSEPTSSELFAYFEEMSLSAPLEPHWHLAFVGVDPFRVGEGIGSALLAHTLDRIDGEGSVAYLESSNPRNVPYYQRHGFEVIREIRIGGGPPLMPMIRSPR